MSRLFAFVSVGIVILGFVSLPFGSFDVDGKGVEMNPAMQVAGSVSLLWVFPLLAVIAPFILGKARGAWWMAAGVLGIGALVLGWRTAMDEMISIASQGFIGRTIEDVMTGNTPPQTIENMAFGTGSYTSAFGLMLLMASGVWDIVQKRKPQDSEKIEQQS